MRSAGQGRRGQAGPNRRGRRAGRSRRRRARTLPARTGRQQRQATRTTIDGRKSIRSFMRSRSPFLQYLCYQLPRYIKPLRIHWTSRCAFFTSFRPIFRRGEYGGPIRSVHALCRELSAAGHDVQVFTTSVDGPSDSDVPLMVPVDVEGVKVTYFPSRVLRRLYWSPPMGRASRYRRQASTPCTCIRFSCGRSWPALARRAPTESPM